MAQRVKQRTKACITRLRPWLWKSPSMLHSSFSTHGKHALYHEIAALVNPAGMSSCACITGQRCQVMTFTPCLTSIPIKHHRETDSTHKWKKVKNQQQLFHQLHGVLLTGRLQGTWVSYCLVMAATFSRAGPSRDSSLAILAGPFSVIWCCSWATLGSISPTVAQANPWITLLSSSYTVSSHVGLSTVVA